MTNPIPKLLLLHIIMLSVSAQMFSQKIDSTYYYDNAVLFTSEKLNNQNVLTSFYTREGNNIIEQNSFEYGFIDSQFHKQRIIKVKDRMIYEDFWHTQTDTIFNEFASGMDFEKNQTDMLEYIAKHLKYPKTAMKNNLQAKVIVSFIVDKDGVITNLTALTNHGNDFEDNAMQVLKSKNKFGVVKYQNRPINLYLTIPVSFVLTD